ncbi:MAG: hypothetical protein K2N91_03835, partial [Muribaculaceae bacterium]|nr:hypothetical protein [Muribaculaceae bacterium]
PAVKMAIRLSAKKGATPAAKKAMRAETKKVAKPAVKKAVRLAAKKVAKPAVKKAVRPETKKAMKPAAEPMAYSLMTAKRHVQRRTTWRRFRTDINGAFWLQWQMILLEMKSWQTKATETMMTSRLKVAEIAMAS